MVDDHHGKDVVSPASFVFRAKVKLQVTYTHTDARASASAELTRAENSETTCALLPSLSFGRV